MRPIRLTVALRLKKTTENRWCGVKALGKQRGVDLDLDSRPAWPHQNEFAAPRFFLHFPKRASCVHVRVDAHPEFITPGATESESRQRERTRYVKSLSTMASVVCRAWCAATWFCGS